MKTTVIIPLSLLALVAPIHAQDADQAAELAKQLANPISSLVSVPFQANQSFGMGPTNDGTQFLLNFQPVIPTSISKDWNLITRLILPYVSQHDVFYREIPSYPGLPDSVLDQIAPAQRDEAEAFGEKLYNDAIRKNPQNRSQDGLGDTTLSFFLSPKAPGPGGIIWGVGPVLLAPTATQDLLGGGKWGAGPTAVALVQKSGWTVGALGSQVWSFAGDDDRSNISSLYLQPFVAYTTKTHTTFTVSSESTYNWYESQWTVPVIGSISQVLKIGKQPVSIQLGAKYFAEGPTTAPEWGLRLAFTLLYPTGKHEPAPHDGKSYAK